MSDGSRPGRNFWGGMREAWRATTGQTTGTTPDTTVVVQANVQPEVPGVAQDGAEPTQALVAGYPEPPPPLPEPLRPPSDPEPVLFNPLPDKAPSVEGETKDWKKKMGAIARIAAGAAVAFVLVKRLFRKREEVPTPPVTPPTPPPPPTPDTKTPPSGHEKAKEEETGEMSKLLEKFAGRVTETLNTYANREDEQNTHFWERWMTTWGRRLNDTTQVDNEYRAEHGMQTLDAQTRVARTIAIFAATVPAVAADLLIPMATGDTVSDVLIGKLRNELYEGLTGDKLGSTATQIAELAASFVPGVTSLNLAIAGLYEASTLSKRGGRIERRFGNKRMGRIMVIVQGILKRKNGKETAPAAA